MKLIILDRDGVINYDSDRYIKTPDEWIPLPGSIDAVARLYQAGHRIVVATNQSGIERGLLDTDMLSRIHARMHQHVQQAGGQIEAVLFCPSADDSHPDRKPNPGLLRRIAADFNTSLTGVPAVGDSLRDLQAARSAGAQPVLVRTGKGERTAATMEGYHDVPVFPDLAAFVDYWLGSYNG